MSYVEHKCCSRCFTITGKGIQFLVKIRTLKRQGHIIWERRKLDDGQTMAIISTLKYPGAEIHKRKDLG